MSQKQNIYDVSNYTDAELLQLLDVHSNVTDRELEGKILQNIYKYNAIGNEPAKKLADFFTEIYSRLFDVSDDENEDGVQEGFSLMQNASGGWDRTVDTNPLFNEEYNYLETNSIDKFGTNDSEAIVSRIPKNYNMASDNANIMKDTQQLNERSQYTIGKAPKKDEVSITKQVDYHKDNLNPILKQTIKRIISIDSQFRQKITNTTPSSTSFTFNLSEPLRDVVSLKLYSVQIPYTWYTINSNFGSNFFYIKGNTKGIEEQQYKIEIEAGNYSTQALIQQISDSLNAVINNYKNINFGNTKIEYLPNQVKTKFTLDIKDIYNQNMYSIHFPREISDFLGVKQLQVDSNISYRYTSCESVKSIYFNSSSAIIDGSGILDSSMIIYSYTGDKYSYNRIVQQININLPRFDSSNTYTEVADKINAILQQNEFLNVLDTETPKYSSCNIKQSYDSGYYMEINILFNKNTTRYQEGLRYAIDMPEISVGNVANKKILFKKGINECNIIYGDESITTTEYKLLNDYTYSLKFECIHPQYIDPSNDLIINFSTGDRVYTMPDLITKLNVDISNNTPSPFINSSQFYLSNPDETLNFKTNIIKNFNNTDYKIKSEYQFLRHNINNSDTNYINMDINNTDYISYNIINPNTNDNYTINGSAKLLIQNKLNTNISPSIEINLSTASNPPQNFTQFVEHIYGKIKNTPSFETSDMSGTNIIRIRIRHSLLTKHYKLHFLTTKSGDNNNYTNFWKNKLMFDSSYELSSEYNQTTNEKNIDSTLELPILLNLIDGSNNTFYIECKVFPGLIGSDAEKFEIKIDAKTQAENGTSYTQRQLIENINNKLLENPFLVNCKLNLTDSNYVNIPNNNYEQLYFNSTDIYTTFDIAFTKQYTTSDYKIVFYDPTNFVRCYVGYDTAKNATWDSTLGWLLGFRDNIEYIIDPNPDVLISNIAILTSDTCISVNIYNYFLIMLDDYTQNHINDGLVTISMADNMIDAPSTTSYSCDPVTGIKTVIPDGLTIKQAESASEKLKSKIMKKSYSTGPFVRDIFGLIPIKTTGMSAGQVYVEFGGTLQNQERTYFGPVNIHRMTIKLLTDRGDLVDLNNANWSFSFICETLYKQ